MTEALGVRGSRALTGATPSRHLTVEVPATEVAFQEACRAAERAAEGL